MNLSNEFLEDIEVEGYHIYGRRNARIPKFYPNAFPDHPELDHSDLKVGDNITIRAFFADNRSSTPRIDSGQISLEVDWIDSDSEKVFGNIVMDLPEHYPLARGTSIELEMDEILFTHD